MAVIGVVIAWRSSARAGCNTIPEVPPTFFGVRGGVDRPFVRAGKDMITIDVPKMEGGAVIASPRDIDVTIIIKPVGNAAPRTVVIAGDGKCERLNDAPCSLERLFCDVEPDCIDAGPGGADLQLMQTPQGARVSFRFPKSRRVGPLTLVVTGSDKHAPFELTNHRCRDALDLGRRPDVLACIDEIVAISPSPSPPPVGEDLRGGPSPQRVSRNEREVPATPGTSGGAASSATPLAFTQLLALSGPNDFQSLCYDDAGDQPHCTGTAKSVTMTIESTGNLVIPMHWTNILRPKGGPYQTRQVRCSSPVEPFKGGGGRIYVPDGAFLESWTTVGTTFGSPPLFVPQRLPDRPNELTLFGTTDKDDSVLRIWRRKLWDHACTDTIGQACEPATAATDCATSTSCNATTPKYYACVGGTRDTLPCTRPSHCPGGQCMSGSKCVDVASGATTSTTCTTDADCKNTEECGRGLFEFRDRAVGGAIKVPRTVSSGFAGICDEGQKEGELCSNSIACNSFLFGTARCVGYRAEAILFEQ